MDLTPGAMSCVQHGSRPTVAVVEASQHAAPGFGESGIGFHRCAIGGGRLLDQALVAESRSEVHVGFGVLRPDMDASSTCLHGFIDLTEIAPNLAEIRMSFGQIGLYA